jgi:hypothetical protein
MRCDGFRRFSDLPKVQHLNSFGFALFGVMFVGVGLYVITLATKIF